MAKIYFHNADRICRFKKKNRLKQAIEQLFYKENKPLQRLDYIFCSDDYLLNINQQHLQHDTYTDIITFELSETAETSGEIYISLDRVKENASNFNTTNDTELLRVVFHGALHLCGYKDKTKKDSSIMRDKEDEYIQLFQS
jgi:probable rRNA maturation factor